jgi:hypothetical protein
MIKLDYAYYGIYLNENFKCLPHRIWNRFKQLIRTYIQNFFYTNWNKIFNPNKCFYLHIISNYYSRRLLKAISINSPKEYTSLYGISCFIFTHTYGHRILPTKLTCSWEVESPRSIFPMFHLQDYSTGLVEIKYSRVHIKCFRVPINSIHVDGI